MVLEIVYETISRFVIAAQEINREIHDWVLQPNQSFIRLEGSLPLDNLGQYMLSSDLKTLIMNPAYEAPLTKLQNEWDSKQSQISSTITVSDIKSVLLDLLGERPK